MFCTFFMIYMLIIKGLPGKQSIYMNDIVAGDGCKFYDSSFYVFSEISFKITHELFSEEIKAKK